MEQQSNQQPTGPQNLTLANIQHLDGGKAALAFNQAIRQIINDVRERSGDKTARKLLFTVEARPVLDKDTATLDTVDFVFKIETKLPKQQSDPYSMLPTGDGRAVFHPQSPFDPRQRTFNFASPPPPPPGMDAKTGEVDAEEASESEASGGEDDASPT